MQIHNLLQKLKKWILPSATPVNADANLVKTANDILITKQSRYFKLVIKPKEDLASNIVLTVTGKNLYSGKFVKGYLKPGDSRLYYRTSLKHRTTHWFPVLAEQGKCLVLSGTAHNRAVWQFKTADGTIITQEGTVPKYHIEANVTQDMTFPKAEIPPGAVAARVYYACLEEGIALDNRMQIEYGKLPTYYHPYHSKQIPLPDLEKGSFVILQNKKLELNKGSRTELLPITLPYIGKGNTISLKSPDCELWISMKKTEKSIKYKGAYGIRWNTLDRNPVCERVGDAKGLTFNGVINFTRMTPYENDFDRIYPWSHMKLCSVRLNEDGTRKIIYSDDADFRRDGSTGNVMVEIPKFYCKREVIDNYEYLWISGTKREGYSLDPSFVTAGGSIDHIYISAYFARIKNKKLYSTSNSYPLINKSHIQLKQLAADSEGVQLCDLPAVLTIQRLFLVETAILDSQSVFTGNVHLPYLLKDKNSSLYAQISEQNTNRIIVRKTDATSRFCVGDAVSVLNSWKEYINKPKIFQREIKAINDFGEEAYEIIFSGEPADIVKQETGITCIPGKNGRTDQLPYTTGSTGALSGHSSFKYRGIENLWGNVSVILDNAYVRNSDLYIRFPTGEEKKLGFKLPEQKVDLSPKQFGDPSNMIVRRMGYDKENPLIMFPGEIGEGAFTTCYYCDAWYNRAQEDVAYILTYGGAWDNKGYAGIFNFRASFTDSKKMPYNGARIMIR